MYKADLHIHTVLSPCGDLEMSPTKIVETALQKGLDIIGIADHNSTLHAPLISKLAAEVGIFTLMGVEICTKEEVHCLAFFETLKQLEQMQHFLESNLIKIKNKTDYFGEQLLVNEKEEILQAYRWLLIAAIDVNINDTADYVKNLGGIFIPAHIDRYESGILSQIGFIPDDLHYDALEISYYYNLDDLFKTKQHLRHNSTFITNSDAHLLKHVGRAYTIYDTDELSFAAIKNCLHQNNVKRVHYKHQNND